MSGDRQRIEAIDARRPGSEDHADPELAQVIEPIADDLHWSGVIKRSEQFDTQVIVAAQEVEVPAQLADRILARLKLNEAAAHQTEPSGPSVLAQSNASLAEGTPAQDGDKRGRRSWFIAIGALAAGIGGIALLLFVVGQRAPLTDGDIQRDALDWVEQVIQNGWRRDMPPAGFEFSAPPKQGAPSRPQTVVRTGEKVGRNAPCPCGSGKKYKKCCGAPARVAG